MTTGLLLPNSLERPVKSLQACAAGARDNSRARGAWYCCTAARSIRALARMTKTRLTTEVFP